MKLITLFLKCLTDQNIFFNLFYFVFYSLNISKDEIFQVVLV